MEIPPRRRYPWFPWCASAPWCANPEVCARIGVSTQAPFHDREDFNTPGSSESFAIMETAACTQPRPALTPPKLSRWCAKRVRASGWSRGASGHVHLDGVVPSRAVGLGPVLHRSLGVTGLVGRADLEHVLAWGRVPGVVPLAPGVDGVLRGHGRGVPGAVHADLDGLDALVLGPGHAGDRDLAAGHTGVGLRDVDARLGLDRPLLGPALLDPERVERAERGDLHVDHPLGRRHVAIQA